ncbi:BPSS1780 family membrane protein [Comamonas kerstersii]|uniref:BPSS1780 family membrane protein n=1 Tax=Comamonas kerstersii TaxID=225992 RepID=UPI0026DB9154|nr:BPSS1780 family membrane protein [Comamonas kerstersii]
MKLHIVPASTGIHWVKLGIQTFWRQPMALTALLFLSMAAVSLIGLFPFIGTYVALVFMPTVFLVMMLGAAEAHQGRTPHPGLVLAPFKAGKSRIQALAILGLFYTAGILLIAALTSLFDDGTLAKLSLGNEPMTPELAEQIVQQPGFQIALWGGFVLYNLLAMLMWHAPALVQWHGVSPVKAIFFSIVACLRNFRAFLMYALGWFGLAIAAGLALSLLTLLLSGLIGSSAAIAANILTIMLGMALVTMFLSSAVFTFRDCFSPPDQERKLHVDDVTYDYK